ncbi:MAG: hypothetical protein ABI947_02900 [Chloroflexota bacterium]
MKHRLLTRYSRFIFLLAAILLIHNPSAATIVNSQSVSQPAAPIQGQSRIGAVESFFRPADATEADLGWERIIFEWRNFQPDNADQWNTARVPDVWLEEAAKQGRMVVGLIKNAPHWATHSDLLGAPPLGLDLPIDDPGNTWAVFVRKLVMFYGTRWHIHHWIIYNEPDIRPENTSFFEFSGSVRDYYKLVKVAYKVAHATDPQALIHLAGFTYWHDAIYERPFYLDRFLHTAYGDPEARANNLFFDVLSVHVFEGTDWVWYITQFSKHLPETLGFSKPVWINEMNARVTEDKGYPIRGGNPKVTLEQQAAFIMQGAALGLAAGAERIEVYKLYDNVQGEDYESWGLVRVDGTRRPAYYALKTASRYFGAATNATRTRNAFATMVTFVEAGRTVYVVWNRTNQPRTIRIGAVRSRTGAVMVSMLGDVSNLPASESNNASYDILLPPCYGACTIQGVPLILIQPGTPQRAWAMNGTIPVPLTR